MYSICEINFMNILRTYSGRFLTKPVIKNLDVQPEPRNHRLLYACEYCTSSYRRIFADVVVYIFPH